MVMGPDNQDYAANALCVIFMQFVCEITNGGFGRSIAEH